ncbi:MAG: carbamoyl phosphate synthase large subunit [Nitrospirae bacterium CG_4_9_14_3_um_filter_53_35]|nr:MAG: carbamoyl phosphate synthase large subunit [Nitrospirae bacterium CG_4_8_14_3_um_filter_50_41]PJA72798.1 MAG: carbamoyl phosphate synthase large subunit [Nitrospirae bacterium CG_4_9_14_3_um_filter_53_35]
MPKRDDIKKILLIGSGPIVIGQACEFDYSGVQACKALKEEGFQVVLVNSNPATIMTDPEFADRTYIEPITLSTLKKIIERERPDALLPTMGGQTALNISIELSNAGILDQYGVRLIGADIQAIRKAEDREEFRDAMKRIGLSLPKSVYVDSKKKAMESAHEIGFPNIIRPSFTLGGTGGNICYNMEEFESHVEWGLDASPIRQILIEESVLGWKEFELEVMRDRKDNVVIVCSIENFDPMGVHTGDSITVAPAQTLTDKEYQIMRDAGIAIIREIGVETGGSNVQFAVHPETGELVVIEMNPRVSRSSALASKATGFPIAKIAAKLAVGYTLDEIRNDITRETPASFEPVLDYCVVKFPRFTFEKFPAADATLTTQMKSVGEAMAIGRTFKEALQKAMSSMEIDSCGFEERDADPGKIRSGLRVPNADRIWMIGQAFRGGMGLEEIYSLTKIDRWFLHNIKEIIDFEDRLRKEPHLEALLREAKTYGFSDQRIGELRGREERLVREMRKKMGIHATFKTVDTCAAEFEAHTPYLYSTYESECEADPGSRKKIMILGGGPNRIGQGIEFDYCCVHASYALQEIGYETIMVNCNPETVSTDYDTSDRLYFEPLTLEHVLEIVRTEKPDGVIVQYGGQTPLKLAIPLEKEGVCIIGTSPDAIDRAEDRERFQGLLHNLGLKQPENGTATSLQEALKIAGRIGYPVVVRPSYVLGGRAMMIVYHDEDIRAYMASAVQASSMHPVLIDKFVMDAIEIDVDAVSDGCDVVIGGIMEHIEEAGVHSGDSACSLPPYSLDKGILDEVRRQTMAMAKELKVVGLMNIQFAVHGRDIFVLEVNPRASRTIPFVSKAIGVPLAKLGAKLMAGMKLSELGFTKEREIPYVCVKEAVFPFLKFPGVDTILGPEMKSTGEVMGIDRCFGNAYAKAQIASGTLLPRSGNAFISVRNKDKQPILKTAEKLVRMGFKIIATRGTAGFLQEHGIISEVVNKVVEGRPHIVDRMKNHEIDLVINTPTGTAAKLDSYSIRRTALTYSIPYFTTVAGAREAVNGIEAILGGEMNVLPLQEYHQSGGEVKK